MPTKIAKMHALAILRVKLGREEKINLMIVTSNIIDLYRITKLRHGIKQHSLAICLCQMLVIIS